MSVETITLRLKDIRDLLHRQIVIAYTEKTTTEVHVELDFRDANKAREVLESCDPWGGRA